MTAAALLRSRRAIVFDLDGTLVDTLPDLVGALDSALAELGAPPVPPGLVRNTLHGGLEATARAAIDHLALAGSLAEPLVDLYSRHYARRPAQVSRPYPGVPELLERLHFDGARLAVCTNKGTAHAESLLRACGLAGRFDAVVGADTCGRRKPDPEPLQHALARLHAAPDDALMVGDSVVDTRAAHAAGVSCIVHDAGYGDVPNDEPGVAARFGSYPRLVAAMRRPRLRSAPAPGPTPGAR